MIKSRLDASVQIFNAAIEVRKELVGLVTFDLTVLNRSAWQTMKGGDLSEDILLLFPTDYGAKIILPPK